MKLDEDDSSGNNDLPITSGTTLILTNERFNIDLDKATSTYILRIRDIQETDGAIYQCQVNRFDRVVDVNAPVLNNLLLPFRKLLTKEASSFSTTSCSTMSFTRSSSRDPSSCSRLSLAMTRSVMAVIGPNNGVI